MQSYLQEGEDIYFVNKYLDTILDDSKFYIELGALDGVRYSNTKMLEDAFCWKGILIEPNPVQFKELEINRPNNHNFNCLVSST